MTPISMSRTLQWISAIVIGLGVVLCLAFMAEFHDRNLGLMIGIGFLIGGLKILLFGAIAPLMQRREEQAAGGRTVRD